jgi:hypothetical protein
MAALDPYRNEISTMDGVAKRRALITPADNDLEVQAKALEILNKGTTAMQVVILDSFGDASTIVSLPGTKDYVPVRVSRVALTGTNVDANLIIHGYFDAK